MTKPPFPDPSDPGIRRASELLFKGFDWETAPGVTSTIVVTLEGGSEVPYHPSLLRDLDRT